MAEDHQRLLSPEPMAMPETAKAPPKMKMKKSRKSRDLLLYIRFKWSGITRALAGSASCIPHRMKPFRLAFCMSKPFKSSSSKSKCKGKKPHASPLGCSLIPPKLRRGARMNRPLLRDIRDDDDSDGGASTNVPGQHSKTSSSSTHWNFNSHPKVHLSRNPLMLSRKPSSHGGDVDDHSIKHHLHRWQHRMNGTLASVGPRKNGVPCDVPKGCIGVYVGVDHTRFVVPIVHLNHPLFASLLECETDVDGFLAPGPLWIPCDVTKFQTLQTQLKQLGKK